MDKKLIETWVKLSNFYHPEELEALYEGLLNADEDIICGGNSAGWISPPPGITSLYLPVTAAAVMYYPFWKGEQNRRSEDGNDERVVIDDLIGAVRTVIEDAPRLMGLDVTSLFVALRRMTMDELRRDFMPVVAAQVVANRSVYGDWQSNDSEEYFDMENWIG